MCRIIKMNRDDIQKRRNNIQFRGSVDDWCGTYVSCSERLLCFVSFPNPFVLCTKLSLLSLLLFGYYCSPLQSTCIKRLSKYLLYYILMPCVPSGIPMMGSILEIASVELRYTIAGARQNSS